MLILQVHGELPNQQSAWEIEEGDSLLLGRRQDSDCSIPWDPRISRRHARVSLMGELLSVCCLPDVSNLIWKSGAACTEVVLSVGDSFSIGETEFTVSKSTAQSIVIEIEDGTPTAGSHTSSIVLDSGDVRLAHVSRNAASLWATSNDQDLSKKVLEMLQHVLTFADLFVILACDEKNTRQRPQIVHWLVSQKSVKPSVSRDLVTQAVTGGQPALLMDVDENGSPARFGRWSFCVPVKSDAATPWCICIGGAFRPTADYGRFLTVEALKSDVIVTELVSHLIGAVRSVRSMENKFDGVRQFLSPQLLEKLTGPGSAASGMAPRETDITALYCDLRGFSRMVQQSSGDLHDLLKRISKALAVMTRTIIDHQGVIADFQGDSALGFWGWPLALTDGPLPACRAALQILHFFEQANQESGGVLKGFNVGIGIAAGRAIAGRIGTGDHSKIGIFGPVVNVASRLEGLTKKTGASILMDSASAKAAIQGLHSDEGRCRTIGQLLPAGFDEAIEVSELLPPASSSQISDVDILIFAEAVKVFRSGDWDQCRQLLAQLPADDRPRDFLLVQIASHDYQPPPDWSGVIRLDSK